VSYAESFTAKLATDAAAAVAYNASTLAMVKAELAKIVDATTLAAETGSLDTFVSSVAKTGADAGVPGQTFTLTAGNDFADVNGFFLNAGTFSNAGFKFTTANDTVNSTQATLTAGDVLVDGSTSDADTLNIVSSATLAGVTPATVTNIENVKITTSATGGGALGMNNFTGVKTVTVSGTGSTAVTLTSVATTGATTVDASGVTATAQAVTASFAASTSTADLTLKGGAGADILFGGLGADTITGGASNDQLSGGANADNIDGGAGNDLIDGGSGNDTLVGGAGTDVIVTSGGNDKVTGGGGNDLIVLATIAGSTFGAGDVITDSTGAANTAALEAGDTTTYANGQLTFNNLDDGEAPVDFVRAIVANDFTVITGTAALVATPAGSNTLVFADTAANNGADTVIGFALGATAAGGDVMDFSAFLGGAATLVTINGQDGNADNVTAANVVVMTNNAAATDTIAWKASSNYVLVQDNGTDTTVSYVTTDGAGTVASTTTVATLIGLADVSAAVAANFA